MCVEASLEYIYYPLVEFGSRNNYGPAKGVYALQRYTKHVKYATLTHLGDDEPVIFVPLRVAEKNREFRDFVGVDVQRLDVACPVTGIYCAERFTVVEHVEASGYLVTLVECSL